MAGQLLCNRPGRRPINFPEFTDTFSAHTCSGYISSSLAAGHWRNVHRTPITSDVLILRKKHKEETGHKFQTAHQAHGVKRYFLDKTIQLKITHIFQ
jgi:hypothetical protein